MADQDGQQSGTHAHHRRVHEYQQPQTPSYEQTSNFQIPRSKRDAYGAQFMFGLTIAGLASSLLTTIYGLFNVDVFLRVYKLPLSTYSVGNVIFSVINTANDVLGAWLVDSVATWMNRSDLIGIAGCMFSICFLTPFFRWTEPSSNGTFDGIHFVASMSAYDTLYSFTMILLGSVVTDNHHMTERERVWFMASGKIVNLIASFIVARIGLALFDETDDLYSFKIFLVALAMTVAVLFVLAQFLMRHYVSSVHVSKCQCQIFDMRKRLDDGTGFLKSTTSSKNTNGNNRLKFWQVARDFWNHPNFWAWIGMELLLESQVTFVNSFLKTFVDHLLHDGGMVSRETCDWLLSVIRPIGLICGILCYIPIRRFGYQNVYPMLFVTNIIISLTMVLTASHYSTTPIIVFLIVYPSITSSVLSSGFHLAQSDMVMEMKRMQALDGRDEPSLAGMFMGANALLCKPAESFLPVVAANLLGNLDVHDDDVGFEVVQKTLYKLLVFPPLVFSFLQWLSWSRYTLTPSKVSTMREELRKLHSKDYHEQHGWA